MGEDKLGQCLKLGLWRERTCGLGVGLVSYIQVYSERGLID